MKNRALIRFACKLAAVLFLLLALWSFLWIASSYSMAFTECSGTYELFSPNPRCRQPAIASLLALASFIGAIAALFIARRFRP
ncbi:hypothetical protein [Ottowia thiooxydans]|uniref:hypothetical protein n=1 Tax=Ottowia thiooxydans TaxID=219182 RepID=UPI00048F3D33|nr:hypothetical protein [Ottowia thiooxydans]